MSKLLILGAGGHGKVVGEIALMMKQWKEIAFLDDDINLKEVIGIPVLGKVEEYLLFQKNYKYAFVAIGNNKIRHLLTNELKKSGFEIPILIHPLSILSNNVKIESGSVVMAGSVINSSVKIGESCIVNTSATIDHDCIIKSGVHVSPGVNIGGTVTIDELSWIGIGSSVVNNVNIGKNSIIGAGSVVIDDLKDNCTAVGVPAKAIKFY